MYYIASGVITPVGGHPMHRLREDSSLNLCMGRPPTGVMIPNAVYRGSVRSTQSLGPTMTAWGQSIGISIGMLPQTLIMSIMIQKTSKYYTTEFDLEEGF